MSCCDSDTCPPFSEAGPQGSSGYDGADAYTTTTLAFVVPAILGTTNIKVLSTAWMTDDLTIWIEDAGYYKIDTVIDPTTVTVQNLGTGDNAVPGINIVLGQLVNPAGPSSPMAADSVTNAMLDNMAANTVKANATNASDNPTNVPVGANELLGRDSTSNIGGFPCTDYALTILDDSDYKIAQQTLQMNTHQIQGGILSLSSTEPIQPVDITAATSVYLLPFKSDAIFLSDGTYFSPYSLGTGISLNIATFTANKNYDIFCYNNAGTPTLEGVVWTNDTTRAVALALHKGVYSKTGSLTRRYIGTIRITGTTGQCEDSVSKRFVYNFDHPRKRIMHVLNLTSHNYTTGAWRAWNNDLANSQVEFVCGFPAEASWTTRLISSAFAGGGLSTGVSSTSAPGGYGGEQLNATGDSTISDCMIAVGGYYYICGIEYGATTNTNDRLSITATIQI